MYDAMMFSLSFKCGTSASLSVGSSIRMSPSFILFPRTLCRFHGQPLPRLLLQPLSMATRSHPSSRYRLLHRRGQRIALYPRGLDALELDVRGRPPPLRCLCLAQQRLDLPSARLSSPYSLPAPQARITGRHTLIPSPDPPTT